jgi:exosortase/archaeosortase family protein
VPITIIANFLRVLALVLFAYYGGIDAVEGTLHDLTGIGLFVVAVALMFIFDGFLTLLARLLQRKPKSGTSQDRLISFE